MGLRVSNAYNEASRQLTATIDAMEFQSNGGDLKVTVCLIEENIVGKQLTLNGLVEDYVHRHVFRTTLNSAYGESLVFPEEHYNLYTKSFTYALPEAYDADNCYVVAYVYDNTDDMKILQTAIQKVK